MSPQTQSGERLVVWWDYKPPLIIMETIEQIIKNVTPVTCENKDCEYKGMIQWCYQNKEETCAIYRAWTRKNNG
jgi:hypothetical protein